MTTTSPPRISAFQAFAAAQFKSLGSPRLALPPVALQVWVDEGFGSIDDLAGLLQAIGTTGTSVRRFLECMADFANCLAQQTTCTPQHQQFALACALVAIERLWHQQLATLWPQGLPAHNEPVKIHVEDPDSARLFAALARNTGLLVKPDSAGAAVVLNHLHDLPDAEYRFGSRLERIHAALAFQADLLLGRAPLRDRPKRLQEAALSGTIDAEGLKQRLERVANKYGGVSLAFVLGPQASGEASASLRAEFAQLQALGVSVVEYGTQAVVDEVLKPWRSLSGTLAAYLRPALDLVQPVLEPRVVGTSAVSSKKAPPVRLFFSYSHLEPASYVEQVKKKLKVEQAAGTIVPWGDWEIKSGRVWNNEIKQVIATADAALLLISDDFLTSTYIKDDELPALQARHKDESLRIFSVIVRPTKWERFPWFAEHQLENSGSELSGLNEHQRDVLLGRVMDKIDNDRVASQPKP